MSGLLETSFSTPPARPKLPDAVRASIRFLPGHSPDSSGNFEIEIYCQARFNIESIEILIYHPAVIVFEKELPSFDGKIKAGKAKLWKIKGLIKENLKFKGKTIASMITLKVKYLYPYEEGLKYEREKNSTDIYGIKHEVSQYEDNIYMYKRYKGKTMKVVKTLYIRKPLNRESQKNMNTAE